MSPEQLSHYLYKELPLASALGLKVVSVEPNRVRLSAPFEANRNGHGTAFGGSLATMGILSGWSMVYTRLALDGLKKDLVIQKSSCDYLAPIVGEIHIETWLEETDWQQFRVWLGNNGKARIQVQSRLTGLGLSETGAIHTGSYVALAPAAH